ncbi:MAG: hypothetical protein J0I96_15950 [Rhodanobacter sp.]|nr:hypothetical protein [Rhodanobacter sp.]ODU92205.1 MAG: hypothetical protein ABT18_13075 [Rhodanobacter sp. SCN 66-43]
MKLAFFPFCSITSAALSIAQLALAQCGLITLDPAGFSISSYSALIAAAIWFDRRSNTRKGLPTPPPSSEPVSAQIFESPNVVSILRGRRHRQSDEPLRQSRSGMARLPPAKTAVMK